MGTQGQHEVPAGMHMPRDTSRLGTEPPACPLKPGTAKPQSTNRGTPLRPAEAASQVPLLGRLQHSLMPRALSGRHPASPPHDQGRQLLL